MTNTKLNCCNNLNQQQGGTTILGNDVVTSASVSTSSTLLLSANSNRRMVKLYLVSLSVPTAELWIRYGVAATMLNCTHPLPLRNLLIVEAQAANNISAICSAGVAQVRVSSVEAI